MAAMVRALLVQSWKHGASSRSPMWVHGPKVLGHPLLPSLALSRELDQSEVARTGTGTHMEHWCHQLRS